MLRQERKEGKTGVGAGGTGQRKGTLNCSPLLGYDEVGNGPASEHLLLYPLGSESASYFHLLFIGSTNVRHR